MQERTVITSATGDGAREGKRLAGLNPNHSLYTEWSQLAAQLGKGSCAPLFLVIVSYDYELRKAYDQVLAALQKIKASGDLPSILVLAACSSGKDVHKGTLEDDNDVSLAQRVANDLNVEVRGTNRALKFDEVGRSLAFARSGLGKVLLPTNYQDLAWKTFYKQDPVEELTQLLAVRL